MRVCASAPGALSSEWSVWMPQSITALRGSCVLIPCRFEIPDKYKSDLTSSPSAIWSRGSMDGPYIFNSADNKTFTQGTLEGDLLEKNCTTRLQNFTGVNDTYFFRLECPNPLKYNFKPGVQIIQTGTAQRHYSTLSQTNLVLGSHLWNTQPVYPVWNAWIQQPFRRHTNCIESYFKVPHQPPPSSFRHTSRPRAVPRDGVGAGGEGSPAHLLHSGPLPLPAPLPELEHRGPGATQHEHHCRRRADPDLHSDLHSLTQPPWVRGQLLCAVPPDNRGHHGEGAEQHDNFSVGWGHLDIFAVYWYRDSSHSWSGQLIIKWE